jgi:hypothetical protein
MTEKIKDNTTHLALLAVLLAVLIYGIGADGYLWGRFMRSVLVNILDPIVWLVAIPFAIKIRKKYILLICLLIVGILNAVLRNYMQMEGSAAGNIFGFIAVGYIINAIDIARRNRKKTRDDQNDQHT